MIERLRPAVAPAYLLLCLLLGGSPQGMWGSAILQFLAVLLIAWGIMAGVILAAFYLRTPAIASRYMLDFAPAFVAILIGLWWCAVEEIVDRGKNVNTLLVILCVIAVGWQAAELVRGRNATDTPASVAYGDLDSFYPKFQRLKALPALPTVYHWGESTQFRRVPYNGEGWDMETGNTKAAVEDRKSVV